MFDVLAIICMSLVGGFIVWVVLYMVFVFLLLRNWK